MTKPPLAVRIVALGLITIGVLSLADILASLFLSRSLSIDLGVLLAPLGLALLRRSHRARDLAVALFGLMTLGCIVAVVLGVIFLFVRPLSIETVASAPAAAALAALFGWGWKVLRSDKTIEWFNACDDGQQKRRPLQFGVSTLFFCMLLAALVAVRFRTVDLTHHPRDVISHGWATANSVSHITYGFRRARRDGAADIIDFVVIETVSGARELPSAVGTRFSGNPSGDTATLTTPDGREIELPSAASLYEIRDGVFRTADRPVTLSQLQAYLAASPPHPNIDDLLNTPSTLAASPP